MQVVANPLEELSATELRTILSDSELKKLANVMDFHSVDEVVAWAGGQSRCPPTMPERIFSKLKSIYAKHQDSCIIEGHDLWYQWRPLLADLFCFFEYFYEDGAGESSPWAFVNQNLSKFSYSHARNTRILKDDRLQYTKNIAIKDNKDTTRLEILRSVSEDEEKFMAGGHCSMTESQVHYTSMNVLNSTLRRESASKTNPKQIDMLYRPMETGEIVIRFFGMKDVDGMFTSHNLLSINISETQITKKYIDRMLGITSSLKLMTPSGKGMKIHFGFWRLYLTIQQRCLETHGVDLEEYIVQEWRKLEQNVLVTGPRRIVFTGHSMGAAFACIAAYRIMMRYPKDIELQNNLLVITFGSPKFARKRFATWIEKNLAHNYITLTIKGDAIAVLPPLPRWFCPGPNKVVLYSEGLEEKLKEIYGFAFEWEIHHFRYWKLMRYAVTKLQPCSQEFRQNEKLLWQYIEAMDYERISAEISNFAPLLNSVRDRFGQYPIHVACCLGVSPLVTLFLKHGANINAVDFEHFTPLSRSLRSGHFILAKFLIQQNADVTIANEQQYNPLHFVCRARTQDFDAQISVSKLLLREKADINAITTHNHTPLQLALRENAHRNLVEFLLENGSVAECDVNEPPLISAILQGQSVDVIKLLLKHNALVRHQSADGNALDIAVAHEKYDLLPILRFAYVFEPSEASTDQKQLRTSDCC